MTALPSAKSDVIAADWQSELSFCFVLVIANCNIFLGLVGVSARHWSCCSSKRCLLDCMRFLCNCAALCLAFVLSTVNIAPFSWLLCLLVNACRQQLQDGTPWLQCQRTLTGRCSFWCCQWTKGTIGLCQPTQTLSMRHQQSTPTTWLSCHRCSVDRDCVCQTHVPT